MLRPPATALLLLLALPVSAQDDDLVDAVAETMTALGKADAPAFAKLAARNEPDPWLVADRLVRAGKRNLALRFARSKPRPAVRGLPEYLSANSEPTRSAAEAISLAQLRLEDDRATKEQIEGAIRALSSAVDDASPMGKARIHSLLGMAYAYVGNVAASSRDFERAAATAEGIGWLREAADALGIASENERVLLRYTDAIVIARRELALRSKLADEPRIVAHLRRLAQLFDENGDLSAATRELDGWAGKLSPEANTELAISRANLRLQQADLTAALDVLSKDGKAQNAAQGGRIAMLAGDILRQQGAERRALDRYSEAAARFKESKDTIRNGRALGNAGISLVRLGKPEQARVLLEQAQAQFDAAKNRNLVALAVLFRGDARLAAGEYLLALRLYDSARTFASRAGDGWLEASALLRQGRALLATNRVDEARRAFSACYELGKRVRAPDLEAAGAAGEARCLLRQSRTARAVEAVNRGHAALAPLVEGQAVPIGDEARRIFDALAAAHVEAALLRDSMADAWRSIELQRLGLQVHTARQARILRQSAMTSALRDSERSARRMIQRATLFEDRARQEEDRATAVRWKSRREEAEHELAGVIDSVRIAARPGWERIFPAPVALASLRERLTPTEVLVSFALTEGRAAAIVVSRAEVRNVRLEDSPTIRSAVDVADQRRLLIDPLELRRSQKRVILILPPELYGVSFGALDGGRSYTRVPSGTEFDRLRARYYPRGEGITKEWRGNARVLVYLGPAPELFTIEEGGKAADLAILTRPIEAASLPRAFFLRGTTAVVAPVRAMDAAALARSRAALIKAWKDDPAHDAAAAAGSAWVVWGK